MFYENLLELCRRQNIAPSVVAKDLGFSSSMPTAWKRGSIPKSDTLQKIADYFNTTTDELLNGEPKPSKLHHEKGERIAVLASVGAGVPFDNINTFDQDDPDSWEEISKLDASQGPCFALRIRGDSMEPYINNRDIVIVRIQETYEDGDIVIALVDDHEGVCKQLEYTFNGIRLQSFNPKYPPKLYTNEQIENLPVRIMGRCIEVRRKL